MTVRSLALRTAWARSTLGVVLVAAGSAYGQDREPPPASDAPVSLRLLHTHAISASRAPDSLAAPNSFFLERARQGFEDQAGISSYQRADTYHNVYPGISLTHYVDTHHVEFAFALRAGADPALIQIRVDGATIDTTTPEGHIVYQAQQGYEIYQHAPIIRHATPGAPESPPQTGHVLPLGANEIRLQATTALDKQRAAYNFSRFNLVTGYSGDIGPAYDYYMGKFELTNRQWVRFLNDAQKNPNNARGAHMFFDDNGNVWINPAQMADRDELFQIDPASIQYRPDRPPGDRYQLGRDDQGRHQYAERPAVGISWFGAVKYCNWLTLSAGRPLSQQAYREGTNTVDWAPVTATNWANGTFSFQERQDWLAVQGFRLPMFNLHDEQAPVSTNFFNEFYKAGSWNGATNVPYGYGRASFRTNDASVLAASLRFGTGLQPVGFFDSINRLPSGRTAPNNNGFGLYDLTGNANEWLNDPPYGGGSDARLLAGGSYDAPLRPLDNPLMVPAHASDSAISFRPVTTHMPAASTYVNVLFCFHTPNEVPREHRERFGLAPEPAGEHRPEDLPGEAGAVPDDIMETVPEATGAEPEVIPDIPDILLRDNATERPNEPTGGPDGPLPSTPGRGTHFPGTPPVPDADRFRLDLASLNPSSGVPIRLSRPDAFGYADGSTAFSRFYAAGQAVTLTAPPSTGNNVFQYWSRNGQPFSPAREITIQMLSDLALTAVYLRPTPPPQRILTVSSSPFSDVPMLVSVRDSNGEQNGNTALSRTYEQGQEVTVTAPASSNGEAFQGWLRNGQPFRNEATVTVTLFQDTSLTAQYGPPPPTEERRLSVRSSDPDQDVPITINIPDNNGLQDGTTFLSRRYTFGTTVDLSAPPTAAGNSFRGWYRNGARISTNLALSVEMISDIMLTAQYAAPPLDMTLTVSSDRPDSGVSIDVSPPDHDGRTDGDTRFERRYTQGDQTTLTAPPTAPNGNTFRRWLLHGSPLTTHATVSITLLADAELTAVYRPPDPPPDIYALDVSSRNPDTTVPIGVTTPDINSETDGTTAFSRLYPENTETSLSAPGTAPNGHVFVRWEVDGAPFSSRRDISITMNADRTVTAIYEAAVPVTQFRLQVESQTPDSLVVVSVSPSDVNGLANGTTAFSRLYDEGEDVTLTARNPAFPDSSIFLQQWLLDGTPFSTNATIQVSMLQDHTVTALYGAPLSGTNQVLSVASVNPDSGVPISLSLPDANNQSDGQTAFERAYPFGSEVTATAPADAPNGNRFLHWLRNGALWTTNRATTVSMIDTVNLTAVYEDPPLIRTLTVASENPASGVNVSVSQPDRNGDQDGATEFQRQYFDSETVRLTTTPLAPDGRDIFARWERDGVAVTTNTAISVTLYADTVMTAIYEPPRTFDLTVRSQNPDSGVTVTVSTPDVNNQTDGDTTFTRTYDPQTTTTLTAPLLAPDGAPFMEWSLNGVPFSPDNQISIEMLSDQALTAVYGAPPPPPRSLTVRSANPDSNVPIRVSPNDRNNLGDGNTTVQRIYDDQETVTLTAPGTVATNAFRQWILNGAPLTTNLTTTVLMEQDHELIAAYGPPVAPQQRVLTVDSRDPGSGVPIEVSEPDVSGDTDGNTTFVRIYDYGASTILTAPDFAGTNRQAFLYWEYDGERFSEERVVTVDLLTDIRMTAVYGPVVPDVTLTVNSQNPDSGVIITVAPADLNAETAGTTEFQRIYAQGENVALSAPVAQNGQPFLYWQFNGTPFTTNPVANITMFSDATMTAVYGDPAPVEHVQLTVRSEGTDGFISTLVTVTPDNNGNAGGATVIQRIYDQGATITLTAPPTSNGMNFNHWSIGNAVFSTSQTVELDMLADTVITAVYWEPSPCVSGL